MKNNKIASLLLALAIVFGLSASGIFGRSLLEVQATTTPGEATETEEMKEPADNNQSTMQAPEAMPDDAVIPEGVYIGDFNVSNMTKAQAGKLILDHVDALRSREIILRVRDNPEGTTAEELGFSWVNPDVVEKAVIFGTQGNLIARYKELKDLKEENQVLGLEVTYDKEKIQAFVNDRSTKYNVSAKDATLTRKNGVFVVTDDVVGVTVDTEQTTNLLMEALDKDNKPEQYTLDATIAEVLPTRTAAQLSQVKDVLGTYSTKFNSGNVGRSKNLATGAGKINGKVLMPGEIFSGYEVMQPFSVANGYAAAGAYENGVVIESVGGGACQIATTLYNAVILAELEVTQRQAHSMIVSYVPYSQDAAIAGTYKDIKFKNNYDYPIYVEGWTSGGSLGFTIFGKETRPAGRTIKYVSVTLSEKFPTGSIDTQDPNMPTGTQKVTQGAYPSVSSQLWKYVYVNGVQTEKNLMHSDKYASSLTRLTVGTGPALPANADPEAEVPPVDAPVMEEPPAEQPTPAPTAGTSGIVTEY